MVIAAPLLIGSGPAWAQVLSVSLVFLAAATFVFARGFSVRTVPFTVAATMAAGAIALQLLPLPAALVRVLSPRAHELRAAAAGGVAPFWLPLTMDVPATVLELGKGMAGLALLLLVGNAAGRSSRARPLVLSLAFIGAVVSIIHIVQRLTGATHILGLYGVRHVPGSGFFGTFVNGNQASSLLALSSLIAAGLALRSEGPMRFAALASALLSAGVVLSTGSRGGIVAMGLGAGLLAGLVFARRFGPTRGVLLALGLVVGIGGLTLWAAAGVRARMASTSLDRLGEQKIRGWRDTVELVRAFPMTGVGRGAFEAPASAFRTHDEGVRLAFPENIALQFLSEWGVPFTLALVLGFALAARRIVPLLPRMDTISQGAACGVAAVLIHELADFGLELPGVAFPTMAALGLVVARVDQYVRDRGRRLGPPWVVPAMVGWGLALAGAGWALPRTLLNDGLTMRQLVIRKDPTALPALTAAIQRHPADYYLSLLAGGVAASAGHDSAGRHLNRAHLLNPGYPETHLVTARWLARNGRRSQAALEFRLAHQHGATVILDDLWPVVGAKELGNAVPQTDAHLLEAAAYLLRKGRVAEAREVSGRAVSAEGRAEAALLRRLNLAIESRSKSFIEEAARDLLVLATEPASFAAAARGLAGVGQPAAADGAIDQGLTANPHDSLLVLAGARQRLDRDDFTGAVSFLKRRDENTLTISDRIQFDELGALLAEKRGDAVTAATLRARARNLVRMASSRAETP